MRLQTQILIYVLCLNLAAAVIMNLQAPGTAYFQPANTTGTPEEYEQRFNATEQAGQWQATNYGIPILGDIFGGFYLFFKSVAFLLAGFPIMLIWIGDGFITDANGRLAYNVVTGAVGALFAVLMSMYVIELITGRYLND